MKTRGPSALPALLAALFLSAHASAQESSMMLGTVLDAQTEKPVREAILRIEGTTVTAVTDEDGFFTLRGLPAGSLVLQLTHTDYGTVGREIVVRRPGETFEVLIHVASQGMTLEVVDAATADQGAEAAAPAPTPDPAEPGSLNLPAAPRGGTVVGRAEIMAAAKSAQNLGDVIRQTIPTLRPRQREDLAGAGLCLEFRGAQVRSMRGGEGANQVCNSPLVYLDGVVLQDPQAVYSMTGLQGVEWIQALSPAEAGVRFGAAPYGVLVVTTTGGAARMAALGSPTAGFVLPSRRSTFDWAQDPQGHPVARALAGAVAGNLAGLALGLSVGRQCIYIEEPTKEIEQSCPNLGVAGVGLAAFALPAFGSALGAHFGGRTGVSEGKIIPALIGASMMIFPGYVFSLTTVGDGVQTMNQVGKSMLVVGTPLLVTLADRMYRKLRR